MRSVLALVLFGLMTCAALAGRADDPPPFKVDIGSPTTNSTVTLDEKNRFAADGGYQPDPINGVIVTVYDADGKQIDQQLAWHAGGKWSVVLTAPPGKGLSVEAWIYGTTASSTVTNITLKAPE